jgi:hypothetical protein
MLSAIMLNGTYKPFVLSFVRLNVVMLCVVAPTELLVIIYNSLCYSLFFPIHYIFNITRAALPFKLDRLFCQFSIDTQL